MSLSRRVEAAVVALSQPPNGWEQSMVNQGEEEGAEESKFYREIKKKLERQAQVFIIIIIDW